MGEGVYRVTNRIGRGVIRLLGIDTQWTGLEHLPEHGPVIIAANHVSYPDFVLLEQVAVERGRYVRFLCRHDVWDVPLVRTAMDRMQHVPVDRQAPAAAYLRARRLLQQGEAVGVFPEAGISWSWTVRALMPGVASLARETGAPVVPVAVWGSQRLWSVGIPDARGRKPRPSLRRGRRVDVSVGEPMVFGPDDDLTSFTRRLGGRLTDRLEQLQRLPHHVPRPGERAPWYPAHLGGHGPTRAEAAPYDVVPRAALSPTWGPPPDGVPPSASRSSPAGS
ncbi:1-acyl-sn-glycerol-3-phosphate acyltransferase [Nocardioides KLBMP 9356]|uniref:1-acyl-sn-glycerol-3-phosphate acyltransferase n=1 Tax=Nocardioides potassii TaxID=2911371 RepID=A0ABS9HD63_9ACTN|nr:lysophospholipid acyltransferase family protein [Nocardioides potassii]MCF6379076.1 1-acyl-sn-glycerol-3-phosphate acyltransferase [Nocardioides potassii]